jgi:hypothetical protein
MNDLQFWETLDQSGGPDACWPWTAYCEPKGYGRVKFDGKTERAHRVAFRLHHGRDALFCCHRCDNPVCCNPAHLFDGNHADNMADMKAKGRAPRGERGRSKITAQDVRDIRRRYDQRITSQAALGREYGLSKMQIYYVTRRRSWSHISENA